MEVKICTKMEVDFSQWKSPSKTNSIVQAVNEAP